jgi:hypothetical protein
MASFPEHLDDMVSATRDPKELDRIERRIANAKETGDAEAADRWSHLLVTLSIRHRCNLDRAEEIARQVATSRPYRKPLIRLGQVLTLQGNVGGAWKALNRACAAPEDPNDQKADALLEAARAAMGKARRGGSGSQR